MPLRTREIALTGADLKLTCDTGVSRRGDRRQSLRLTIDTDQVTLRLDLTPEQCDQIARTFGDASDAAVLDWDALTVAQIGRAA